MNFSLGDVLEQYIAWQVKNGPFNNASEVVRDALRMHQLRYQEINREVNYEEDMRRWREETLEEKKKSKSGKRASGG